MNAMQNVGYQSRHGRACSRACGTGGGARESRGAFTLVELLVVIAIIALLVSILLPAIAGARKSAWGVICSSNERQLGIAISAFLNDQKDPRFLDLGRHPAATTGLFYQVGVVGQLQEYLGGEGDGTFTDDLAIDRNPEVGRQYWAQRSAFENSNPAKYQEPFSCPAARGLNSVRDQANAGYLQLSGRVFVTPFPEFALSSAPVVRYTEYWFNDSRIGPRSGVSRQRIRLIKHPDAVVWATDALDEFPRHSGKDIVRAGGVGAATTNVSTGVNNFLFQDGSVRQLPFRDYNFGRDMYGSGQQFYNWGHFYP